MFHHDRRPYEVALREVAQATRARFETMIESGPTKAGSVIAGMLREKPKDFLVPCPNVNFYDDNGRVGMEFLDADEDHFAAPLHRHAFGQVVQLADMGARYAKRLQSGTEWERNLLRHNLNELFAHRGDRQLIRAVDAQGFEVRGVLSDRYKRMDNHVILEAFIKRAQALGAQPVSAVYTGTQIEVKMLIPRVYEPVSGEVLAFGVSFRSSDFGNGALVIRCFMLRPWCTNMALSDDTLRKIHAGKRLPENLQWSEATHKADLALTENQVNDVITMTLSDEAIERACGVIKAASEETMDGKSINEYLKRSGLLKAEQDQVKEAFSSADVVNMPPGQNKLRLANAISWIANELEDTERALVLQEVAGKSMNFAVA